MDIVVAENYRQQGIEQKMVKFALSHPELKDVYQRLLGRLDAQGVYKKLGFEPLKNPGKWMSIIKPRPDRTAFSG